MRAREGGNRGPNIGQLLALLVTCAVLMGVYMSIRSEIDGMHKDVDSKFAILMSHIQKLQTSPAEMPKAAVSLDVPRHPQRSALPSSGPGSPPEDLVRKSSLHQHGPALAPQVLPKPRVASQQHRQITDNQTPLASRSKVVDVDICIPVFDGHLKQVGHLLSLFNKYLQDRAECTIRLIPGNSQEAQLFAAKQQEFPRLRVVVQSVQALVEDNEGPDFLRRSGLGNDKRYLELHTKWSWQSVKKMYCVLTSNASHVMALDSESMMLRKTNLTGLISAYYQHKAPIMYFNNPVTTAPRQLSMPFQWQTLANQVAQQLLGQHNGSRTAPFDLKYYGFTMGYWWIMEPGVMRGLRHHWIAMHSPTTWFERVFQTPLHEINIETIYLRYLVHFANLHGLYTPTSTEKLFEAKLGVAEMHDLQICVNSSSWEQFPLCGYKNKMTRNVVSGMAKVYAHLGVGGLPVLRFACYGEAPLLRDRIPELHFGTSKQCSNVLKWIAFWG